MNIKALNQEVLMMRRVIWRTFLEQWEVSRKLLLVNVLFIPVTALLPLLAAYLAGTAINKLVAAVSRGGVSHTEVYLAFAIAAASGLASSLITPIQRYIRDSLDVKLELYLERKLNYHITSVDLPTLESPKFVELFNKVVYRHVWAHRRVTDQVFQLSSSLIQLIGAGAILVGFAIWLLPVLFLAILPTVVVSFYIGRLRDKVVWKDPENIRGTERQTSNYIYVENTNIEIRLNTAKKFFLNTAERLRKVFADRELKVDRINFRLSTATTAFEDAVLLLVQLSFVARVLTDRSFGIGTYTFYFQTVSRFSSSSSALFTGIGRMYEDCLILRDYYSIADLKPTIKSHPNAVKLDLRKPPLIEFKNVSFTYPGAEKPIISDLSFTIRPGEKIALVGENGAGKTTIVKLLSRLYDVSSGSILIDGIDIRDLDLESWHKHLGTLMQNYGRYIYDVKTNVGVGRVEEIDSLPRIEKALDEADAGRFIKDFKKGLDQPLSTMFADGVNPSGGQWQRMALARAMFRQAQVLILDEPTAAVDAKAEYQIFRQLIEQQKDKTTVIISHRFSTVRRADTIYVLESGRIIENGSHKELIEQAGLYKSLFDLQAEGYR